MSDTLEQSAALIERLENAQFEWVERSNRWVFPITSLEILVNFDTVSKELLRISPAPIDTDQLKFYTGEVCLARKKLLTVVLYVWGRTSSCCKTIMNLVDDKITDSDLPFECICPVKESPRRVLCLRDHTRCTPSEQRCIISAFADGMVQDIRSFSRDQWMVLSPVFLKKDGPTPHYELDDRVLMPFKEDLERTHLLEGGYSDVWPVRICDGHQDLYESSNPQEKEPLLAVKRLYSIKNQDFEKEAEILRKLADKKHQHLVKLLGTYKYLGKYHFLFPYAMDNLRNLWKSIYCPQQDSDTYYWALYQMTGLASGLDMIHSFQSNMVYDQALGNPGISRLRPSANVNFVVAPDEEQFGRHGDLKPENILWSNEVQSKGPGGILQITDFGLGRFHRLESRSRVDPRNIGGSATYVPPEILLQQLVSRSYDIWSLGCVFLEFVTWLLEGQAGLDEFTTKRMERASDGVEDDTFYSSSVKDGAVLRPGVRSWIKHLNSLPQCSKMVHELLQLLETKLLVVDAQDRINARDLYLRLRNMGNKARSSTDGTQYLIGKR